ncbi:cyclic nucleotide-binding domain-containing protein [Vibrio astriarenae]|uniref:Cyclic nucleotide-binding domain-containing protein n=1 Tax=Vibrio astriarenae TaxID=1481923 RepID=A0A7Z2YG28_9VIBR|nr:Crp/Fnr family transcriptional regulator [Vibrio astriarenae]QIA65779.1 cyclic nucleotide-binding domain-containing protein [Vibrio astriarenae]
MTIQQTLSMKLGIDNELAQLILQHGRVSVIKKGSFLYYQDDTADYIALPIDGVLGFHSTSEDGAGVYYNLITPGTIINDTQLMLGGEMATEIRAASDCRVLLMSFKSARALLQQSVSFSQVISHSLAKKQRLFNELFLLRMERSAPMKILRVIKLISGIVDNGYVPLNIQSLASLLGISRNTVGKELKSFIQQGVIAKSSEGYFLPDTIQRVA